MKKNVTIAKELVKLAKTLVADEFDPKTYGKYGKENALDFEKKSIKRHAVQMTEDGSIQTREGKANYKAGDWIVTDEQGGKYPVHDDDFRRLYKVTGDATEGEFEAKPKKVRMFRTEEVLHIKTEWGDYTADKGDWVVLNNDGSLGCPVKPDAVESAYKVID